MNIGGRFVAGTEVYGENSYYPLPYVMVFALYSLLPRTISIILWFLAPVLLALIITNWDPLILLFAPVFGHFVGGQSAIFGLLGIWGYRRFQDPDNALGGVFLAITLLKPQLGIVPVGYAIYLWVKEFLRDRRIPIQAWVWATGTIALYLPSFIIMPDWPVKWLSFPRPLSDRALSGLIPRSILFLFPDNRIAYWSTWVVLALASFYLVWTVTRRRISLDTSVLWGFVVSPLAHDYDLIQVIPGLDTHRRRTIAALVSLPGWIVILFYYSNDTAWFLFALIAPCLLVYNLYEIYFSNLPK